MAGQEFDGLPIAERDGAGLIQQQRVDVAGGFHRLSAHRQHVVLHDAIHAGDADGGEQAADGGRDQADQQRDQNRDGGNRARAGCATLNAANGCSVTTASRKISVSPAIRMFSAISFGVFCRCAPSTRAIMRSRNVSPGLDVMRILIWSDSTLRAAGDGAAVAAGFADDRRAFAGDDGFVHRRDAFDHLAVSGDEVAGVADHDIAGAQVRTRNLLDLVRSASRASPAHRSWSCAELSACALPRASAIASAKFANSTVNQSQSAI